MENNGITARPQATIRIWPAYLKAAKLAATDADMKLGEWLEATIKAAVPVKFRKDLR